MTTHPDHAACFAAAAQLGRYQARAGAALSSLELALEQTDPALVRECILRAMASIRTAQSYDEGVCGS